MVRNNKAKPINIALQAMKIKSIFPDSKFDFNQNQLIWKYDLSPTPLSRTYSIKMIYTKGKHPDVFVTDPKLTLFQGEKKLPHVYNTSKQWLCLYVRKASQWNKSMFIADTIIPWISEWLFHYECWLATGVWHGGGIEHGYNKKD